MQGTLSSCNIHPVPIEAQPCNVAALVNSNKTKLVAQKLLRVFQPILAQSSASQHHPYIMSLFRRFLHRRKAHPIGLCERCSKVCWESLFDPTHSLSGHFPIYKVPPEELKAVACQLCQFVGNALITFGFSEELGHSTLPYQLQTDWRWGMLPPTSGIANLQIRQRAPYVTAPLAKVFVVTENQNIKAALQDESLIIGGMPLRFVRQSLANCQQFHKGEYLPDDVKKLSSFTVYDCESRKVVCAPPDCEYVALSYVWGPHKNDTNVATDDSPEAVPRTVEDSVRVTLRLGYRYLWADRYVSTMDISICGTNACSALIK